jgi:hypothetical protein
MINLDGVTKIEFTVQVGLALITRNGKIERCEDAQELMNLCAGEDPSISHIEHNAATAEDLEHSQKKDWCACTPSRMCNKNTEK